MSRTIVITSEPVARFSAPPADRMAGRPSRAAKAKAANPGGNYVAKGAISAATEARANNFLNREALLDQAVLESVISDGMRAHYAQCYDADPEGTRSYLRSIGLRGAASAAAASEVYMENHLSPAERSRITAAREGRPPSRTPSRIVNGSL